jgi:hypothetical protein
MSTSAAVWSTHLSNGTSGVASALVSVTTALLAAVLRTDNRPEDLAQVLGKIERLEQAAVELERWHDKYDEIDRSSVAESPRADLCEAREGHVSNLASADALLVAVAGLRHLVETRPDDALPPEIAKRLLSAISLLARAVERGAAFRRRAIAGIEHEIDSRDVELLLAKPPQPVPWDEASKAFGLT